jgi:serine/threonine-protein kinase
MPPKKIGRYKIEGLLGQGTMGVVFKAYDPALERYAAIKVMNTGVDVDDELRARFFREARSAAKLNHPNIISIYELGENKKRPFIAMEYVEGEDLKAIIRKRAFIPLKEKLRWVSHICEGLDYAHGHGVIHRDIKPGNIFITKDGKLKILDFGLARLASSEMTRSGMLLGSPYYMSPEQVKGSQDIDGRSDLFSVGVVLYELMSYRRPFEADTPTSVCFQIVSESHHPIPLVLPGCTTELEHIINRSLDKNRDTRYQNGSELTAALLEFQEQFPRLQEAVEKEIESLQAKLKKGRNEFKDPLIQGLADDKLFDPEKLPPEGGDALLGSEFDPDDYGNLLLRHADLKRRLDLIAQRTSQVQQILELFQSAHKQLKNNEQDACRTTLQAILKLHPGNAEALRFEQTLQEHHHDQKSQLQLETALAAARNALDQEDFERCLKVTSSALELSPGHPAALALKSKALEGLNLGNLEELLVTVRQSIGAQDYESSYQTAAEGLKLHPEHPELLEIRQRAKKAIDQQRQVANLLEKAHRRLDKEKYSQALKFVEKVLALEPEHPEALELKRSAQEALDPGRAELKELQEDAAENSTAREEYQIHVGKLLEFVRSELQREDLKSALHNLSFLLELEPNHPEALKLKDETEAALREQGPPAPPTSDQEESASEGEDTQVLEDVTRAIEKKTRTAEPPRVPLKAPVFLGESWLKPLAGGVLVVLLLLAAVTGWPGNQAEMASEPLAGSLILNIVPWANVDSITRIDTVEAILVEQDLTTPCVVPIPPGKYRIQVSNPYFQGSLEFEVNITAGEPSVIHKKLPTFDLEQALSAAVEPGL